jgi:hypothetical protein
MPVEMNYIMPDGEDPYAMPDDVGRMPGGGDGRPRAANGRRCRSRRVASRARPPGCGRVL